MEETSLSDFVDSESSSTGSADEVDVEPGDTEDERVETESAMAPDASPPDTPEPPTCQWNPDGITCEACGTAVTRVWFADGRRVCEVCKTWE